MNWRARLRFVFTLIFGTAIVVCAYWNIASTYAAANKLGSRELSDLEVLDQRVFRIRQTLTWMNYHGEIGFVTNRDLQRQTWTPDDNIHWATTQYAMLPWMVVHGKRDTPFLIADFWDGLPDPALEGFSPLYDAGSGLMLFRAN